MKRATSRKDSTNSRRQIYRSREGRGLAKIRSFASGQQNPMCVYGYARVSTSSQELDIQLAQLDAAGCERVFCEKESGTKDNRRVLSQLLRRLRPGDVVIVSALDRLTRGGPFKMLSILAEITSRGAAYKS
ncbi:recombinase family protein, partial [Bradyrhizobium liaoningense]